jgi:hypothetical protein
VIVVVAVVVVGEKSSGSSALRWQYNIGCRSERLGVAGFPLHTEGEAAGIDGCPSQMRPYCSPGGPGFGKWWCCCFTLQGLYC